MFITDVSLSDEMRAVFEQAIVAVIVDLLAVP